MKATMHSIRHGGICRSDVSSHLAHQGRSAALRTGPVPAEGRAGNFRALLIVGTSPD